MPNYYEILQISPDATIPEVEAACEAQYNRWRRLVTHHDPGVVNKANQALQFLETARATLLDPAKRAAYDTHLGVQGPVGGLADPQARPRVSAPLPPKPHPPSPIAEVDIPPDTWICPKCHAPNVRKMPYCPQCGEQVAHECPKCGEMIEKAAQFCSHCGVDVQIYKVTQRFEVLREQLQMEQRHLDYLRRRYNQIILLPKNEEEWSWHSEFIKPGSEFGIRETIFFAIFLALILGGSIVGFQIGALIDPRGAGWGGPSAGAKIGAMLGMLVVPITAVVVYYYIGYNISFRPKVQTRIELCRANIVQLEQQIQNLGVSLPISDE